MSTQTNNNQFNRPVTLAVTLLCTLLLSLTMSSPTQAQTGTVDFVGQIGGANYAVFVDGNIAYIGEGPRLVILDISNPANPVVLSRSTPLSGVVNDIYVSGSYAYVATEDSGLQIINVNNPANPSLTGSYDTPGIALGVAVSGSYAYVADVSSGLQIINISNPTNPTLSGSYDTPGIAYGVAVSGSYAYMADGTSGLQIINISNPTNPTLSGSYDTPGFARGVVVSSSYAYVADEWSGLQIINISTPANPTLSGSYDTPGLAWGVAVSGSYAYVADQSSGLQIITISNPANPTLSGSYDTPGLAWGVAVSGSYAYVADEWSDLQIINISNPANPTLSGSYDTPGNALGVAVSGSYAYVADSISGLQIINISNPANPTLSGSYDTPGNAYGVAVSGSYAYVADYYGGLQVLDISNPANPTLSGSYDTPGRANDVAVSGSYAYVADESSGLQIINISNPANPTLSGSYDTPSSALGVAVSGSYAYVADSISGLQIINISNPANPTLSGSYDTPSSAEEVAVSGNYAYVADWHSGLQIINISNPANPTLSGSYDTPGEAFGVAVSGSYAYVADELSGLQIINISNPVNPTLSGSYDTPNSAKGVAVSGSYAYVADVYGGLFILQFNDGTTTPDLTLSSLTLSPSTTACQGDTITINATEQNSGTGDASSHQLGYYLDSAAAGYSNSIGNDTISSLTASSSSNQSHVFTANTAGTWYVKALADSGTAISESDETNNGDSVTLTVNSDTDAPTGSITINGGAASTITQSVTLTLSATDSGPCATGVDQMQFSNDGTTWSGWESYATSKAWTLSSGEGTKTVYVQFRDVAGNISSNSSDTITLDNTPPASSVTAPTGMTTGSSFSVTWSGSDATSGVKDYDIQVQQDGGAWTTWQTDTSLTSSIYSGAVDGATYCFRSRAEDNVGNIESYPAGSDVCTTISLPSSGVSLSPASLNFGNQAVNTTSTTQTVTLENTGTAPLTITNISVSGDYAQNHNCPVSLPNGNSCTIRVSFIPTTSGSRLGTLTISSDADSSPDTVSLSGTGFVAAPVVNLNPTSLSFGNQAINTTSATQSVTLENTGTAPLTITNISISGNYAQSHTCPASLSTGNSCTINIAFTPVTTGSHTETLTISSNATSSPDIVSLNGMGVAPAVSLSPQMLDFDMQAVDTASTGQTIKVQNSGDAPLTLNGLTIGGDFSQTNTCPATLAINERCDINVTFKPTTGELHQANLTITSNAPDSPHTVALSGLGFVPSSNLSLNIYSNVSQAQIGDTVQYTYVLTNTGNIQLTGLSLIDNKIGLITDSITISPNEVRTFTASYQIQGEDAPGPLSHQVTISGSSQAGPVSSQAQTSITLSRGQPSLALSVQPNLTAAQVGESIHYRYWITNSGNLRLNQLTLNDSLVGQISLPTTELAIGAAIQVQANRTVAGTDLPGPMNNTAQVSARDPFGVQVKANDSASLTLRSGAGASLQVDKRVTPSELTGYPGIVTYTYILTNNGAVNLTNIELVDDKLGLIATDLTLDRDMITTYLVSTTIPEPDPTGFLVNVVTASTTLIGSGVISDNAVAVVRTTQMRPPITVLVTPVTVMLGTPQRFSLTIPSGVTIQQFRWDMGNGEIVTTIEPVLTYTYEVIGTFQVTLTGVDENNVTYNGSTMVTILPPPPFEVLKWANPPAGSPVPPNSTLIYTIIVTHTGTDIATNVSLEDSLPTGVTFVESDSFGHNNGSLMATLDSLVPGSSHMAVITVTVNGDAEGILENSVLLLSDLGAKFSNRVTHTVQAVDTTLAGVTIVGPASGLVATDYQFTAVVTPSTAQTPISYQWSPAPVSGQGKAIATYHWRTTGRQQIMVTASNANGSLTDSQTINLKSPPSTLEGDAYELDDLCNEAASIEVDGPEQFHTFHQVGDEDWVAFTAEAGSTYIIEARVPPTSTADVKLVVFSQCGGERENEQDNSFNADVRLKYPAPVAGTYYLQLTNKKADLYGPELAYHLSVRREQSQANGALIIVSGKLKDEDPLQDKMDYVTNNVYDYALSQGCTADDIYYLAHDDTLPGFDAPTTLTNLDQAITQWAPDRVGPDKRFSLFFMDHGQDDKFYLNGRGEYLTPQQLDEWLNRLEQRVPGVEVNVIMEACYSGSFIDPANDDISQGERLIMTSAKQGELAYASSEEEGGAYFADAFLGALQQGANLQQAFDEGSWHATAANADQIPWIDANGNGIANEAVDKQLAQQRGFACSGPPPAEPKWPPDISDAYVDVDETTGSVGIWAEVQDDTAVDDVWVVVYPPSYQPQTESETLAETNLPPYPMINTSVGNLYGTAYGAGFTEQGVYRVVIHARDAAGLQARPRVLTVSIGETGEIVYLPMVLK